MAKPVKVCTPQPCSKDEAKELCWFPSPCVKQAECPVEEE